VMQTYKLICHAALIFFYPPVIAISSLPIVNLERVLAVHARLSLHMGWTQFLHRKALRRHNNFDDLLGRAGFQIANCFDIEAFLQFCNRDAANVSEFFD
jgi:hypothetical protein